MDPRIHLRKHDTAHKIGQMLVVGFPEGGEGVDQFRRAVREFFAGNVILFTRNLGDGSEVFALTSKIRSIARESLGVEPLISIDQEGGIVARLRRGVTPLPGAMAQAAAVAGGRSVLDIRALGRIAGTELRALGIDWDLAPVADVNVNPSNPVIGVRSYGEDPAFVANLASAFAAGLADAGVMATAKHFPGHGDTIVDSHLGLPLVPHGMERLESVELLPFRRLVSEGVAAVMTAHVRFPAVEPEDLPATLSSRVVEGLLRSRLGFRGLACTDCLEMKAIAGRFPHAFVQAVQAGIDLLFVSHSLEAQAEAAASIGAAVRGGVIPEARIDEAVGRILAAKAARPRPPSSWEEASAFLAQPDSLELARGISRDSLTVLAAGRGFPEAGAYVYVDIMPANLTGAEDGSSKDTVAEALAAESSRRGLPAPATLYLPEEPAPQDVARATEAAAGHDVVLGLHSASTHPGQVELARRLAAASESGGRRIALVSMRSPYDLTLFPDLVEGGAAFLCAYEYSALSARSVAEFLAGGGMARGRCPVRVSVVKA